MIHAVAAGLGVALVPEQLKKLEHENVVFRFEQWGLEDVVEMTADYCRRREDAKFEAAVAELEC